VSTWAVEVVDFFRLAMLLLFCSKDYTCFLKKIFCDAFAEGLPPGSCLGRSSARLGLVAEVARTVVAWTVAAWAVAVLVLSGVIDYLLVVFFTALGLQ